jgi:hypothetical protein
MVAPVPPDEQSGEVEKAQVYTTIPAFVQNPGI